MSATARQDGLRHYPWSVILAAGLLAGFLTGCTTISYYYQSAKGQLDLMHRARDIDEVLGDEAVSNSVRERLKQVVEMRRFASEVLHLPDNESYRSYADLERDYALWNVFAAPRLSTQAHEFCFPIVGCVVYRGYFDEGEADRYARKLQQQDLETFVAGVPAYSTLGWFDDPVLNTIINYQETELAGLIFHELAHQVAYAKGDSIFNESFATAIEIEGVERWLEHLEREKEIEAYRLRRQRNDEIVGMILDYRGRLEEVYQSDNDDSWKLDRKAEIITSLKGRYAEVTRAWAGYRGYGRWFAEDLNNAHFVVIAAYHDKVSVFRALLAELDGDLKAFYDTVVKLSRLPEDQRNELLDSPVRAARIAEL